MTDPIRILIADDHPLICTMVSMLLDKSAEMALVGQAHNGAETQTLCQTLQPDILLLDLSMAGPSPQEIITFVRAQVPATRILILTAYEGDQYFFGLLDQIAGYLLKTEPLDNICEAIRTIMEGGVWFSQPFIQRMVTRLTQFNRPMHQPTLTPREQQILHLTTQGSTNQTIADQLNIRERTVRYHLRNIYDKLGVQSRAEAIVWAIEMRLTWPTPTTDGLKAHGPS